MIALRDAQPDARDAIKGASYFAQEYVEAISGKELNKKEEALDGRGFAVSIGIPVTGTKMDDDSGSINHISWVTLPIFIEINTEQNSKETGAQKEILVAIEEVFAALGVYKDDDNTGFDSESTDFELLLDDAGLLAYVVWVRKQVIFTLNSTN